MPWLAKIALFKLLSAIPGGSQFYRFLQETLTKSLVPTPDRVRQKLEIGFRYLNALDSLGQTERLLRGTHLDFGAGWQPTIPLLFYALGVSKQYLFDLVPVLDETLVNQTANCFRQITESPWPQKGLLKRQPPAPANADWKAYLESLGISYVAPYADFFPSLEGRIDMVTSTQVLLHIPREPSRWCFSQIFNSLKPGGIFMATIHLRDLYADKHKELNIYNHLQYSPETWERWVNSALMSYNRFKARDYRELLEGAKFKILAFDVEPGSPQDLKQLDSIQVHPCFQSYSREELAARHLFFVAQKP